jgi:hypothetical protein
VRTKNNALAKGHFINDFMEQHLAGLLLPL